MSVILRCITEMKESAATKLWHTLYCMMYPNLRDGCLENVHLSIMIYSHTKLETISISNKGYFPNKLYYIPVIKYYSHLK